MKSCQVISAECSKKRHCSKNRTSTLILSAVIVQSGKSRGSGPDAMVQFRSGFVVLTGVVSALGKCSRGGRES